MSHRVRVDPSGVVFEVDAGESVMAAAARAGFDWPTLCRGQGTCRVCVAVVVKEPEALAEIRELERRAIADTYGAIEGQDRVRRLGCQARVVADGAVLFKRGVKPSA